ncbi:hypothetical protein G9F72_026285 [Clostridium estertheticum]|uniref:hypothetical protein n=1 Tax=Clostridium estertheticum TaxID=238834 RepID=UPI0013E97F78|nr:hypothetical protein [Clostridium estertheticum]MBZ9689786.1 hypothetical protein [Clostridium estertheticum]
MSYVENDITKTIENPFYEVFRSGDRLTLGLNNRTYLSSKAWAAWFGVYQDALRTQLLNGSKFTNITIDFTNFLGADPLPLISLTMSLKEFSDLGGKIEFSMFKKMDIGDNAKCKLAKSMLKNGFINTLSDITDEIYLFSKKYEKGSTILLKGLDAVDEHHYIDIMPITVIDTLDIKDIEEWIDERLIEFYTIISSTIPDYAIEDMMTRIKIFLTETVENIARHAYPNKEKYKYAGIYIRFREGLNIKTTTEKSFEQREYIKKLLKLEEANNPKLIKELLEERAGAIEVFILDSGIGISESLREYLDYANKKFKYPFVEAFRLAFIEGKRRMGSQKNNFTNMGGLYLIGELMRENKDFIWGRDDNNWVGSYFPVDLSSATTIYQNNLSYEHCGSKINGLSWVSRFTWIEETENIKKFQFEWNKAPSEHPVYKLLQSESTAFTQDDDIYFQDYRFSADQKFYQDYKSNNTKNSMFFIFPKERCSKKNVWKMIQDYSDIIVEVNNATLIIVDIPIYDMVTYINALNNSQIFDYRNHFSRKFDKIILVSRRMGVSVLKLEKGDKKYTYEYNLEFTEALFETQDGEFSRTELHLDDIMSWVRWHDSLVFWNIIKNSYNKDQLFINAKVKWGDNFYVKGFLNFAQTITIPICMNLYRINLERIAGLFNSRECKFNNLDSLTSRISSELNSKLLPKFEESNLVNLGSVYATGYTEKDKGESGDSSNFSISIHLFQHDDSKHKVAHLFLWPKKEWIDRHFNNNNNDFERIGKTYAITEVNGKYFSENRKSLYYEGVYRRSLQESYKDFQKITPRLVRYGHYVDEAYHDLIQFNIRDEFDQSFKTKGELASFVLIEIFISLGGKDISDLSVAGRQWWKIIEKQMEVLKYEESVLLVYNSNLNTDFVMEKIRILLSDELNKKIFAFIPINKHRDGSSLLISPLLFNDIETKIKLFKDKKERATIVLLSSVIVSGRTINEFKNILLGLGADDIKTLSIIDRQRLMYCNQKDIMHKSYWRVDLPRLGFKDACPLCKSLELAKLFINELISNLAKKRINEWIYAWGETQDFVNRQEHGITKSNVNLEDTKKWDVDIKDSIGLTLYVTEMHSMTSRNDIAIELCKNEKLTSANKIELLCSQILLFGREYSRAMHIQILKELFEATNLVYEADNYSALAALVLINQEDYYIDKLIEELCKNPEFDEDYIINEDMCIVLAYFNQRVNNLKKIKEFKKLERLIKGRNDIRSLYNCLHSEIYSDHGSIHSKPIPFLINNSIDNSNILKSKLEDTLNSIDQIIYILKSISNSYFIKGKGENVKNIKEEIIKDLQNLYCEIECIIIEMKVMSISDSGTELLKRVKKTISPVLGLLMEIHELLFCKVGKNDFACQKYSPLNNKIDSIIDGLPQTEEYWLNSYRNKGLCHPAKVYIIKNVGYISATFPNSPKNEIWFCWDAIIEEEFKFLLNNIIYSEIPIANPFTDEEYDETADMWVNYEFNKDNLTVSLANSTCLKAEEIMNRVNRNKRFQQEHIENIGGKITYNQRNIKKQNIIIVKIMIPYLL